MGTAVLRSHDCLKNNLHVDFFNSRPPPMNSSRKKPLRSPTHKKQRQARSKPKPVRTGANKENTAEIRKPLVMGQVTILKRGEALSSETPQSTAVDFRSDGVESLVLCSTNRLGPDPEILPKLSDLSAIYAGPAYISSPAPSSLPFPAFFLKRTTDETSKSEIATKGLRCLLRLDDIA